MKTAGACCTDCRGVVTVPSNTTGLADITKNVDFYSLAHFSALVPHSAWVCAGEDATWEAAGAARAGAGWWRRW